MNILSRFACIAVVAWVFGGAMVSPVSVPVMPENQVAFDLEDYCESTCRG